MVTNSRVHAPVDSAGCSEIMSDALLRTPSEVARSAHRQTMIPLFFSVYLPFFLAFFFINSPTFDRSGDRLSRMQPFVSRLP